ncbi:hypothetical protein HMPREF9374_2503 [Desmospora sp. 8437]|nr:hypothetical protein HMPREF9374_2503 [Desmospora sp. 8437]
MLIEQPIGFAGMLWSLEAFPPQVSRLTMGFLSNPSLHRGIVHHPLRTHSNPAFLIGNGYNSTQ